MKINIFTEEQRRQLQSSLAVQQLPFTVEVLKYKERRSLDQNALYFAMIDKMRMHIADSTGQFYSADELHEWLKAKFLPSNVVDVAGEKIRCRQTTTKLDTAQMAEYIDKIMMFCADSLGLII